MEDKIEAVGSLKPDYLAILAKYEGVDPDQVLLVDKEAAILVEQATKTLEGWRNEGRELPFVKLGRYVRYRLSDVLRYRSRTFTSSREARTRRGKPA